MYIAMARHSNAYWRSTILRRRTLKRLVVELTDRCNLACSHCYEGRHGGRGELALDQFDRAVAAAARLRIGEFSFTGGEPTLHRHFGEIVRRTHAADLHFSLVTNGWTFDRSHLALLPYRDRLTAITFSLDGANEATHDRQRGADSFRRVIAAAEHCAALQLPFTFNFVISPNTAAEISAVAELARNIGAAGIRFIPFLSGANASPGPHDASLQERIKMGMQLLGLQQHAGFAIGIAPGFFSSEVANCHSLKGEEFNLSWTGKLDICCHLSGHVRVNRAEAVAFRASDYPSAAAALDQRRKAFVADKVERDAKAALPLADYFACDYCVRNWMNHEHVKKPGASLTVPCGDPS